MHHDVGLYFIEPLKYIFFDHFNSEEHRQTFLVIVQKLVQVDSDHVHGAVVGLFAEFFHHIFVQVLVDSPDHRDHILLILFYQVFVQNLRTVFFWKIADFWRLKKMLIFNSLCDILDS
jgi:hypothetical protein